MKAFSILLLLAISLFACNKASDVGAAAVDAVVGDFVALADDATAVDAAMPTTASDSAATSADVTASVD